ncbi:MAG TPA: rhamnose ABC transporter substrate-binding protein [Ilumatobacter sp.]|nr:rhamnose ABC transporter substrate-binding protein [Ilumatobacter sp.]
MKFHQRALASVAVVALIAGLSACGDDDDTTEATDPPAATDAPVATDAPAATDGPADTSGGEASELSITFLPKNLGNPYFDTSNAGGERAIQEFGGSYQQVGPDAGAPDAQVPFINTAAQQGVDALVVSANDPNAICAALNEARDAGVAVVTFDSDTDPTCRDLFINQATAEGIARIQIDLIAEQIGGSGQIAILSASANATNQNAWIELMEAELAANHPDIELVDTVYGDDDDQTSFDRTAALLQTYPDLAGIISPTTVGVSAAARYLSTSEYKGEVALTGLGTPNQMRAYVEDGTVTAFALWNPGDLGYLAAYAAKALAEGTITGAEGDTFTAGELGEYTVDAGASVLLGDPFVFNADNIADFDF